MSEPLTWESTYAIALALKQAHPGIDMETVTLGDIQKWTFALENFDDDPALVNDEILSAIYLDWYEEILHER
jgi:FeS assembly protein IscX